MKNRPLTAPTVFCLGMTQLINWGITFYMPGVFGAAIMADTGWSSVVTFSGLTVAMLVMGVISPLTGLIVTRVGGRMMMMTGTLIIIIGCFLLAFTHSPAQWIIVWIFMGAGMRLALYDAAFALLVETKGAQSRRAISQVTLLGGLASALFWPAGAGLLHLTDWRHATLIYGCAGLISLCFLAVIPPKARIEHLADGKHSFTAVSMSEDNKARISGLLYASLIALLSFVSTGISTHLPQILNTYGMPALTGMLWGVGQVGARLLDVAYGARTSAIRLNLLTGILLPLCFLVGLAGSMNPAAIAVFVLGYGAINGLNTVVKAILPLVLFHPLHYARKTGILLSPGLFLAALAPTAYASLLEHYGVYGTLFISALLSLFITAISIVIWQRHTHTDVKNTEERADLVK